MDGTRPGCTDGALLGNAVGNEEMVLVGELVGEYEGTNVGIRLGCADGAALKYEGVAEGDKAVDIFGCRSITL